MKNHLFLGLTVLFSTLFLTGCWDTGNGEKIGSVTRLQHSGVICKTWEGIIQRGGINNGSGVMGAEFHFTVEDDALAEQVQKAMVAQQEVKIAYRGELTTFCRSDSQDIFLTKIEPLNAVSIPPTQSKEVTIAPPPHAQQSDVLGELLKQNRDMIANQQIMLEEMLMQRESSREK